MKNGKNDDKTGIGRELTGNRAALFPPMVIYTLNNAPDNNNCIHEQLLNIYIFLTLKEL